MDSIIGLFQSTFSTIGPFILLLGLLVFVHELGHFLVAKWCGVKVEVFSLGFGKKIFQYTHGETTYALSMIPLGGYVKMYGESLQADVSDENRSRSFIHKPVGQRIAIVLAGPLMNLFFAFFLFVMIGVIGDRQPAAIVGDLPATSKAYEAGFRPGDKVVRVEGEEVQTWGQLTDVIAENAEGQVSFEVVRGAESLTLSALSQKATNENIFSRNSEVPQIEGLTLESDSSLIGVPDPTSLAYLAGLRSLDLVTHVNDEAVNSFRELQQKISSNKESLAKLKVQSLKNGDRGEEREITLPTSTKSTIELGIEFAETYVLKVKENSPAAKAGLVSGDKVVSINQKTADDWSSILATIKNFDPGTQKTLAVTALRDGQELNFQIEPEMTELMTQKGQEESRFTIGIISSNLKVGPETVLFRPDGVMNKLTYGVAQTWQWTEFTVMSMVRLFQGMVSPKNIGGVITIGRVASHSYEAGISVFLKTMAIISINLFLLNLLPVPVLDGGHLVFFGLEALKGSPVSLRKLEIAQQVGLTLLLLLMAFALFNDVSNLFFNRW